MTIISLLLRYAMARRFTLAENTTAQLQSVDAHVLPYDRNPPRNSIPVYFYTTGPEVSPGLLVVQTNPL